MVSVSRYSVKNRATSGTNIRPSSAATRNHSRIRRVRNNTNKTPALRERLQGGPDGGPRVALPRRPDAANALLDALSVQLPAR